MADIINPPGNPLIVINNAIHPACNEVKGVIGQRAAADHPHAEDRKALLKILHEMEAGINSQDIDHMVSQMDVGATVTWLNGEISRGHEEIRAYYHRMVKGDQRIITKYTSAAKLGAGARFYGNGLVAVADGTTEDEFFPIVRGPFRLHSNWSATAAKLDGQWKIVNLHLSANVFSNSLMDEAKAALLYVGCGGLVAGGLVGWFISRRRRQTTQNVCLSHEGEIEIALHSSLVK